MHAKSKHFDCHGSCLCIATSSSRHRTSAVASNTCDSSDANKDTMRQRLRTQHYLRILPVSNGSCMSLSSMASVRDRLIAHEKGHANLHRWWLKQGTGAIFTPSRAVAFWHSNIEGGEDPARADHFTPDLRNWLDVGSALFRAS